MQRHLATALSLSLLAPACALTVTEPGVDTPVSAPFASCVEPRAHGAALAWVSGGDVVALDRAGVQRTLDRADGDGDVSQMEVSPDGWVVVSRQRREGNVATLTWRLLGPDGARRWARSQTVTYDSSPFRSTLGLYQVAVGVGGTVAAAHARFDGERHVAVEWIDVDGRSRWLHGASLAGAPDAEGRVPLVRQRDGAVETLRWDARRDALETLATGGQTLAVGRWAVRLEAVDGRVAVDIREGARSARVMVPVASLDDVSTEGDGAEGWLLLASRRDPSVVHRVDLARARVETLPTRNPDGLRGIMFARGTALDDDGSLLRVLRDDHWGALYRSTDGVRWARVGRAVTGTLGVTVDARGGSYVVHAHSAFYGGDTWPEAPRDEPGGLRGWSMQVVRPATGVEVVVTRGEDDVLQLEPTLSANGHCAAWVQRRRDGAATAHVVDLVTGARMQSPMVTAPAWRGLRWL